MGNSFKEVPGSQIVSYMFVRVIQKTFEDMSVFLQKKWKISEHFCPATLVGPFGPVFNGRRFFVLFPECI